MNNTPFLADSKVVFERVFKRSDEIEVKLNGKRVLFVKEINGEDEILIKDNLITLKNADTNAVWKQRNCGKEVIFIGEPKEDELIDKNLLINITGGGDKLVKRKLFENAEVVSYQDTFAYKILFVKEAENRIKKMRCSNNTDIRYNKIIDLSIRDLENIDIRMPYNIYEDKVAGIIRDTSYKLRDLNTQILRQNKQNERNKLSITNKLDKIIQDKCCYTCDCEDYCDCSNTD